jgi:integrase
LSRKRARGNGDADVWPRKNKEGKVIGYRGSYWVHTTEGRKRRYVSGKTKGETRAALNKAKANAAGGLVFDAQDLRLDEYLDRWLTDSVRDTVRQRTWERYEQIARTHLKPTLGRVKLKDLTPAYARGLYREKLDAGLAPRTVQYIHTTLSKALKDAVTDELIPRNVAKGVRAPRPANKEIHPLSPDQVRAFLDAVRGDRLEALYVVAVQRGLRQGELLGLKWDDVDLEAGTLQVRRTLSLTRNGHVFESPKNGKGRSVELTQSATDVLRAHLERQLWEIEASGDGYQDQSLVFPGERGQPMRPYTLTRKFERILKHASLPHIRFHDLRHTCATLLLSRGVHPKFVQELLGHATISITLDRYSHVIPAMGDQTRKAMEDVLS